MGETSSLPSAAIPKACKAHIASAKAPETALKAKLREQVHRVSVGDVESTAKAIIAKGGQVSTFIYIGHAVKQVRVAKNGAVIIFGCQVGYSIESPTSRQG
jgi:hypothetical protein